MQHDVIDPDGLALGVRVRDLDPTGVGDDEVVRLRELLARYGVLVLANQPLDDAGFLGFLRSFGALTFTEGETPVPGHPDLNVVTNVGRSTPPRSSYHVDTSYVAQPPAYTALRAVTVPAQGGQTLFSNQYRAHDTLSPERREQLAGRTVTHVMTGLQLDGDAETSAVHPLFRPHPLTGRTALYLSTPQRCAAVSGMDAAQAAATVAELLAHSTRADNVYRHRWSPGDIVMWDNGCVLHKADHTGVVGDRVMHRGMVAGYSRAA